jgi:HSP20 family molecular chaperone IbpA
LTTSRRIWVTSGPDNRDGFQRALDDLVDDAVTLLEGRLVHVVDERAGAETRTYDDEMIESSTHITFIMHVPGYRSSQLKVSLLGGDLVVTAPDFTVRRPLHASVDGSSLTSTYVNGVLSAQLQKTY